MSDEQPNDKGTPPWPTGEPDDSEPSPERQAELRAAYEVNVAAGKPPYAGVVIGTRGEVNWIVRERGWRTGGFSTFEQRLDLRRTGFSIANLGGAAMNFADLREAGSDKTNFSKADLTTADLSGAVMEGASFAEATLVGANLSGARFTGLRWKTHFVNFSKADLSLANLSGTVIRGDLRGACLRRVRMDASTVLIPLAKWLRENTKRAGFAVREVEWGHAAHPAPQLSHPSPEPRE